MRKTIFICAVLSSCLTMSQNAQAGDAAKGAALYKENDCTICHSRDGMGEAKVLKDIPSITASEGPRIAGLAEDYAITQMVAIQGLDPKTERKTDFTKSMKKQIKGLSKTDIDDLAAYISKNINPEAGAYKSTLAK
jgi:cytochrome c553